MKGNLFYRVSVYTKINQLAKMKHLLSFLLLWRFTDSYFVCNENSFRCKYDQQICVPVKWICDGTNDCLDGSDEILCGQNDVTSEE